MGICNSSIILVIVENWLYRICFVSLIVVVDVM